MKKLNNIETFIIFCLESYKDEYNISGADALNDFNKYDVFEFLESGYEVLHTQSMHYIIDEIANFIEVRK